MSTATPKSGKPPAGWPSTLCWKWSGEAWTPGRDTSEWSEVCFPDRHALYLCPTLFVSLCVSLTFASLTDMHCTSVCLSLCMSHFLLLSLFLSLSLSHLLSLSVFLSLCGSLSLAGCFFLSLCLIFSHCLCVSHFLLLCLLSLCAVSVSLPLSLLFRFCYCFFFLFLQVDPVLSKG